MRNIMPNIRIVDAPSKTRQFTTLTEEQGVRRERATARKLKKLIGVPNDRLGWPRTWPFTCQLLGVGLLQADMAYQRDLDPIHMNNIHNNFNPVRVGTLAVNKRPDGTFFIMDGQHRLQVLRWRNVSSVWCKVYEILPEEESGLITLLNRGQKRFNVRDRFRADLAAGKDKVWGLYHAVAAHGFTVDPQERSAPNHIEALDTLLRLHKARASKKDSPANDDLPPEVSDKVGRVLSAIHRVWGTDEAASRTHYMLLGVDLFLDLYAGELDDTMLDLALKSLPIGNLYDEIVKHRAALLDKGTPLGTTTVVASMIAQRYPASLDTSRIHDAYRVLMSRQGVRKNNSGI